MRSNGVFPATSTTPRGPEARNDKSSSLVSPEFTNNSPRISIHSPANVLADLRQWPQRDRRRNTRFVTLAQLRNANGCTTEPIGTLLLCNPYLHLWHA